MVKINRGEHMVPSAHKTDEKGQSDMKRYMPLNEAMSEVHKNVPENVKKTGKKGKAKEAMLRAIAFSKAGEGR